MLRAVLFDLDGTLLDIRLGEFLDAYFGALGPVLSRLSQGRLTEHMATSAVNDATRRMCGSHPGRTNRDVFHESFLEATGIDLDEPADASEVASFYAERFPLLQGTATMMPGAAEAIAAVREAGLPIAIATNPIFPAAATHERMRWAGLDPADFSLVTTFENCEACKPAAAYYRGVARSLGIAEHECMMVGDDAMLDLAAADVGMTTYFTGTEPSATSTWRGDLVALASLIPRLVD